MEKLQEQFVTFEIAQKLKEIGFTEPCMAAYSLTNKFFFCPTLLDGEGDLSFRNHKEEPQTAAPLWQQAIEFLATKGVEVHVIPQQEYFGADFTYFGKVEDLWTDTQAYSDRYKALSIAIEEGIKIVKQDVIE